MWFKNLRFYHFSENFSLPENFEEQLAEHSFHPCSRTEQSSFGWFSPFGPDNETLTHSVGNCWLLCAKREEKVLPSTVVNAQLDEKVRQISEAEGRSVPRKEKQNLKEDLIHQLLPQAFSRFRLSWGYIDLDRQFIAVDESAANKAEDFLGLLRGSVGSLPVRPFSPSEAVEVYLTDWLQKQDIPAPFELGDEAELRSPQADGGIIRCKQEDLTRDDIQAHLTAGKQVTRLGLVWQENLEFILEADMALKRVKPTDVLLDAKDDLVDPTPEEKVDADFALISGEAGQLFDDLKKAFE
ncbi:MULTISPECIES: recombination-associated protein RdgC [Idiomarina]|jgi:recombination associated protein RdgC|uniref:Recombination-associated protein RdgC n=1 Tax=Idiomarina zobellii TaxID=86103 RepID=A0A837NGC7_9GAMM|nr:MULTISPECIES: recombination-associated protein RdgC [Idiomarina]KTG29832.1 recombinase [Idiomarina sp. H105]MBF39349.1 recombination-associated protein RdgC [Idiomarinaceae bacterium]OAF13223.1 recombinase [Idiomarina sp. WRN-38]KPD23737.1 recombinase [Idiomarina zobellii]MCH2455011.1 recombination-associated protein RdgC [Idiomarina sp.]|tara:strand:- start:2606 stop:3496 length:891 start_codon:yes stop_codon:yes gene_type:complete